MKLNDKKLPLLATCAYLLVLLLSRSISSGSSDLPGWLDPAVAMIAAQVVLILVPALLFVWLTKLPVQETLRLHRLGLRQAVKCLLLGFISWPIFTFLGSVTTYLLALLWPEKLSATTDAVGQGISPWIIFVTISLITPICEEVFFRGMLLSVYEKHIGLRAILPVGILFALLHLGYDQVLGAAYIGFVAGWVVYQTRSLWAGMLVHSGCNLVSGLMVFALSLAASVQETAAQATPEIDLSAALLVSVLVWGIVGLILMIPTTLLLRSVKNRNFRREQHMLGAC
ncbi:MAG: CPBP family intramembrane metalloprotease [Chloroflexi bacterium]|nr:MAG: CPBP family intramembrane metalloprotease [Chloroflexota bacterium]